MTNEDKVKEYIRLSKEELIQYIVELKEKIKDLEKEKNNLMDNYIHVKDMVRNLYY